jgi:hypothetical protein
MSQIQEALVAAMRDICKIGIGKTSKADKYNYRGIDAAMNEMSTSAPRASSATA